MNTRQVLLDMVCTEAIEYGGLQEVPANKHGTVQSYHSQKRRSRGNERRSGGRPAPNLPEAPFTLRPVKQADGSVEWVE
jgi:hypothetical protein